MSGVKETATSVLESFSSNAVIENSLGLLSRMFHAKVQNLVGMIVYAFFLPVSLVRNLIT